MLVYTKLGLIKRERLTVHDIIEEHENARVTATEWYLDNELVRRDVHVNILRGISSEMTQGSV